jgi:hypothetical protein
MTTNKHRKKKHLKRNVNKNITHKRHYRKRRFKNNLREYLVSNNRVIDSDAPVNMDNVTKSGNMIHGLRDLLSVTNNIQYKIK